MADAHDEDDTNEKLAEHRSNFRKLEENLLKAALNVLDPLTYTHALSKDTMDVECRVRSVGMLVDSLNVVLTRKHEQPEQRATQAPSVAPTDVPIAVHRVIEVGDVYQSRRSQDNAPDVMVLSPPTHMHSSVVVRVARDGSESQATYAVGEFFALYELKHPSHEVPEALREMRDECINLHTGQRRVSALAMAIVSGAVAMWTKIADRHRLTGNVMLSSAESVRDVLVSVLTDMRAMLPTYTLRDRPVSEPAVSDGSVASKADELAKLFHGMYRAVEAAESPAGLPPSAPHWDDVLPEVRRRTVQAFAEMLTNGLIEARRNE